MVEKASLPVGLARIKAGEKGDLGYAIGEADGGFTGGKGLGLKGKKRGDLKGIFVRLSWESD